jgi:predicted PurR-regulated permease PerM
MTRLKFSSTTRVIILGLIAILALLFLSRVRGVLWPFLWAIIAAYVLDPFVDWLSSHTRLPRRLVVMVIFVLGLGLLGFALAELRPLLARQLRELIITLPKTLAYAQGYLFGPQRTHIFGIPVDPKTVQDQATLALSGLRDYLSGQAVPIITQTVEFVAQFFLFLIATFYILLEIDRLGDAFVNLFPRRYRLEVIPLLKEINQVLGAYLRGQLLLIVVMASVSWVALTILGVRYTLVLAVATGILEIFPLVGPVTAASIVAFTALFQPTAPFGWTNLTLAIVVIVVYTVLRYAEDYLVVPHVIGRIVALHPLVVIFALICGGALAGVLGLLFAVPTVAMLRILSGYLYGKLTEGETAEEMAPEPVPPAGNQQIANRQSQIGNHKSSGSQPC